MGWVAGSVCCGSLLRFFITEKVGKIGFVHHKLKYQSAISLLAAKWKNEYDRSLFCVKGQVIYRFSTTNPKIVGLPSVSSCDRNIAAPAIVGTILQNSSLNLRNESNQMIFDFGCWSSSTQTTCYKAPSTPMELNSLSWFLLWWEVSIKIFNWDLNITPQAKYGQTFFICVSSLRMVAATNAKQTMSNCPSKLLELSPSRFEVLQGQYWVQPAHVAAGKGTLCLTWCVIVTFRGFPYLSGRYGRSESKICVVSNWSIRGYQ